MIKLKDLLTESSYFLNDHSTKMGDERSFKKLKVGRYVIDQLGSMYKIVKLGKWVVPSERKVGQHSSIPVGDADVIMKFVKNELAQGTRAKPRKIFLGKGGSNATFNGLVADGVMIVPKESDYKDIPQPWKNNMSRWRPYL